MFHVKPVDFAYKLRQLTDGFKLPGLTDQRGAALFEEYGSHPSEVVERAIGLLLQGDRYPNATQMRAAFEAGRLWDHEQRRRNQARHRGKTGDPVTILNGLAYSPHLTAHPMVVDFCQQALRLYVAGRSPSDLAQVYRTMAAEPPLLFMRLDEQAAVLDGWGESWPAMAPIFPVEIAR